ncbi:hypothetical protein H4R20_000279 [Coemansia guatemalensis]|uniref:Uncharacterized protein n=1 Tax=Coemansia guatemalensis TaxID=2761395 RepID=A0A9W8I468_9FUNG|nr:hypothetical protein H4R20_000279 [Coemansia guatemalensis]
MTPAMRKHMCAWMAGKTLAPSVQQVAPPEPKQAAAASAAAADVMPVSIPSEAMELSMSSATAVPVDEDYAKFPDPTDT